jgi:hypothetical protein
VLFTVQERERECVCGNPFRPASPARPQMKVVHDAYRRQCAMRRTTLPRPSPPSTWRIVRDRYGATDVLELRDVGVPRIGDDEVLLRVRAAGLDRVA